MTVTAKPLLALTAADLVTRSVVTVPQDMRLADAARLLAHEQISGAPVTDADGHCVGILSATDFVHWAEDRANGISPRLSRGTDQSILNTETLPTDTVCAYMTSDPVTVGPWIGLRDLARLMLDAHIHRLVVVDEQRWPSGIVSSTDILAALAYAEDSW
jgi:CBS-domain-containing membrane protein